MKLKRINANGLLFDVRPDTSDEKSIQEVVLNHGYSRRWFSVEQGERWLDLGANIGAFSCFAASQGAHVEAYEAEPSNVFLSKHNVEINELDAKINHAAVVHDGFEGDTASLGLSNTAYGLWRHSLYKTKSKQRVSVPVARISSLLADGVDGVKMDIEGAEIDILYTIPDFYQVKKLCLEYHFDVNDSISLFRHLMERLQKFFSRVECGKIPEAEKYTWFPPARIVFCAK